MIIDKIDNYEEYLEEHPEFKAIYDFIKEDAAEQKADGSYELDGRKLFCNISTYRTELDKEVKFEAYKKYADLQYIYSGIEKIGWSPLGDIEENIISEEYSKGGDIAFYDGKSKFDFVLTKGTFLYLAPEDAHAPCQCAEKEMIVRKMVFKILL